MPIKVLFIILCASILACKTKNAQAKIDYLVFGVFCGECTIYCSPMFKLDLIQNTLSYDSTDSYLKNNGVINFGTQITDSSKLLIAKRVFDDLPSEILMTNETSKTFGCPDCSDGCGLYIETKSHNVVRKFYIDLGQRSSSSSINSFVDKVEKSYKALFVNNKENGPQ